MYTIPHLSYLLPIFISHRHSHHWIFTWTRSAMKEQSIWQVHCKRTQWGSTSLHLISYLLLLFHTDNNIAGSSLQQDRRWRSTAFGKCDASEQSEARLLPISSRTYYLHFTQTLTSLNLYDNKIGAEGAQHLASALQVNTVRLDSLHLTSYLLSSFHTDTHIAESSIELHRRWRSTSFGKRIASEQSEPLRLSISSRTYYLRFTQTLTSLNLESNKIGIQGAEHLASALRVNRVRLDCSPYHLVPTTFILHRLSHRWILKWTTSAPKEHTIWQAHCKWTQ